MTRLFLTTLCTLALFATSCHKNAIEQPEPEGSLEGTWRVGLTEPIMYDAQDKVIVAYQPQVDFMDYTQLKFTATDLEQYHVRTNKKAATTYVRVDDKISCPSPSRSYTIRKLTTQFLDLHLRGEYQQLGSGNYRTDLLIHFERQ